MDDRPNDRGWPDNGAVGYKGPTTLREAFASSRNAAMVRLTQELGVGKVAEVSRRLGVDPGPKPDAGFVLGTFSTNVLAMTAAYAAVANGGYRVTPTGVLAVVDGYGQVRDSFFDAEKVRVIPQKCIGPTRSILGEVIRTGTGRAAALRRWKAFGKTGTTTGNADAWFIGWSEGRVLGTWMGRRRNAAETGRIAGKDAPAHFFSRVANSVNEMVEYRERQERRKEVAGAPQRPAAGPGPNRRPGQARAPNAPSRIGQSAVPKQGIDLPGGDYRTIVNIDQRACERACVQDRHCQAFTYRRRLAWCYLKDSVGPEVERADAVSRIVRETTGAARSPAPPAPPPAAKQ